MPTSAFETTFPITFQKQVSVNFCKLLKNRYCINLVGFKRVGINCYLRYFLNHPQLKKFYLSAKNLKLHFVLVDLNDLFEKDYYPFWILTQKRIADSMEYLPSNLQLKKDLQRLFLSSIQSKELFLIIDNIRESIKLLIQSGFQLVIFFNRFDRLGGLINTDLFCNLESLRDTTNRKLSYIFTTYRELSEWSAALERHPSLSLLMETMYIKPVNSMDGKIVANAYLKTHRIKLSDDMLSELIALSGGSIQFVRLFCLALIQLYQNNSKIDQILLSEILQIDERVLLHCDEIWESLSDQEKATLTKLLKTQKISESEHKLSQYLWNTGLIIDNEIFSPVFAQYLKHKLEKHYQDNSSVELSKKESLLFDLFKKLPDQIIERSLIIDTVWPDEAEFGVSDWAIDRLIGRLRMKLRKQHHKYEIITVKTRGFKMVNKD